MIACSTCSLASMLCAAAAVLCAASAAAEERIELHDLVTAAPLPAGYSSQRKDFDTVDGKGNTLILIAKPGEKSRIQVTIDNKKLTTKEEKVAAFKGYVNGIHGMFVKRGYAALETEMPDSTTLDPTQPLDLRMKLRKTKGGDILYVDAEVFFTDHGYTVWSVTPSETEREKLVEWIRTVKAK